MGWCIEFDNTFAVQQSNYTKSKNASFNEDCCKWDSEKNDPSNLCFRSIQPTTESSEPTSILEFAACIPARESLNKSPSYCYLASKHPSFEENSNPLINNLCLSKTKTDEARSFHCITPSTEQLLQMKRKKYDDEAGTISILKSDFLFVGNPAQVYEDVIISNYIPR